MSPKRGDSGFHHRTQPFDLGSQRLQFVVAVGRILPAPFVQSRAMASQRSSFREVRSLPYVVFSCSSRTSASLWSTGASTSSGRRSAIRDAIRMVMGQAAM
ncbi:hypothetical protein [Actinomadura rubrisoli]|uniref:Uncharacterized protein n=1 Tax=Actinomadura rubrisoli TaxID=2530368 RepID=A0A4R5BPJ5_9ACTN|nr:hypothetical protein [Actinomadura rubrisoli]TDD87110.1 hypothetical protein E1298_16595 [Actinomadura rubrisoli]